MKGDNKMNYQEEREQEEQKQKTITEKIAKAMGWGIVLNANDWHGVIAKGDERLSIYIETYGANKGRVKISGDYNSYCKFLPYNKEKTEITVSPDKTPEKIAKDIHSRLLPAYQKQLKEARERKQSNDDYEANKKAMLEDVATFIPSPNIKEDLVYGKNPSLTVKFTTIFNFENDTHKDGFELEVSLTPDKMKKVLAVIYA